jgi:hypothetical protein
MTSFYSEASLDFGKKHNDTTQQTQVVGTVIKCPNGIVIYDLSYHHIALCDVLAVGNDDPIYHRQNAPKIFREPIRYSFDNCLLYTLIPMAMYS